jgi:hypothetical protein
MADRYYTDEITAVPFGTMRRIMAAQIPVPLAFVLAAFFRFRRLLRWPLKPMYGAGGVDSGRVVASDALPPRAVSRWAPIMEQLGDLGFSPLKYTIADVIGVKQQAVALLLDGSGGTLATVEWIRMRGAEGIEERSPVEFDSYADDDPEIMTASLRREDLVMGDLLQLDFVDSLLLPDHLSLEEVYRRHLARTQGRSIYQMAPEYALEENKKRAERRFRWTLEKGIMRPLTDAEVTRLRDVRLGPEWD